MTALGARKPCFENRSGIAGELVKKQRASIKEHNGNIWIGGLYCAEQLHLIFRKGKLSAGGRLAGLEVMLSKT